MSNEKIQAWVTTYALSGVIKLVNAEVLGARSDMIRYGDHCFSHGEGRDWHRTPEAALARAEEMRKAKIASLRKSIAKLEKMTFTAPPAPRTPSRIDLIGQNGGDGEHYPKEKSMSTDMDTFDLSKLGILREGHFDSAGIARGWQVSGQMKADELPEDIREIARAAHSVLHGGETPDSPVLVRDIEVPRLTAARKRAMRGDGQC